MLSIGEYVEIKEAKSAGRWAWTGRKGHITATDNHCHAVRTDDGETVRDMHEHFRKNKQGKQ